MSPGLLGQSLLSTHCRGCPRHYCVASPTLQKVSSQEHGALACLSLGTEGFCEATWLSGVRRLLACLLPYILVLSVTTVQCKAGWTPLPNMKARVGVFAPGTGTLPLLPSVRHVGHSISHFLGIAGCRPLYILELPGILLALTSHG